MWGRDLPINPLELQIAGVELLGPYPRRDKDRATSRGLQEMRWSMGERAFPDRPVYRPIDFPKTECKRSASRWGLWVCPLTAAFMMILCCLALASCATAKDDISARRDRAAQKLTEEKVWKSGVSKFEPQVMAAARTATPAGSRTGSPEGAGGSPNAPDPLASPPAPGASEPTLASRAMSENAALTIEASEAALDDKQDSGGDAPNWLEIPDEELVRELLLRKLKRWENQAGGYSHASNLTPDNDEQRLARDLVTLGFLADSRELDGTSLEAAAMTLSTTGDREDLIRAALTLQQLGKTAASDDILRRLAGEKLDQDTEAPEAEAEAVAIADEPTAETAEPAATTPIPVASTPSETSTFELVSVTFASRIDGPGDFVAMPAAAIQPGKDVLVYGEFSGFRTLESPAEAGAQPTHSRAFSANLRLENAEMNILEELKFLPPSRGRQVVDEPGEAVNFWARYEIPDDLDSGQYQIVITAEDHFGGQSAKAELSFEVK